MYISNMYYKKIIAALMAVSNHPNKSCPQVQPDSYQHHWALKAISICIVYPLCMFTLKNQVPEQPESY